MYSTWNPATIDFQISLTPHPLPRCVPFPAESARFKAVGVSGKVYYSNSRIVQRRASPYAPRGDPKIYKCPDDGDGGVPIDNFAVSVETAMAPACGLPSPGRVAITVTGDYLANARLSVQSAPNGPFVDVAGLSIYLDTGALPEGRYGVRASGKTGVAEGSFVVDRLPPAAQITYPGHNQSFCPIRKGERIVVPVEGIAEDPNFRRYDLEYGAGENPSSWVPVASGQGQAPGRRGVLGDWDVTGLPSGTYSLRLRVYDEGGNLSCSTVTFTYLAPVRVVSLAADRTLFSPNGDGIFDSLTFTYDFDRVAAIAAKVYALQNGQRGAQPVRTIFGNTQLPPGISTITWDGRGDGRAGCRHSRHRERSPLPRIRARGWRFAHAGGVDRGRPRLRTDRR